MPGTAPLDFFGWLFVSLFLIVLLVFYIRLFLAFLFVLFSAFIAHGKSPFNVDCEWFTISSPGAFFQGDRV